MQKTFIILFFVLVYSYITTAQNELYFSHLGTEHGLTIDKANDIVQDQKGFIWIGTINGLTRYDGYDYVTYQPQYHDSTSISNREITKLLVDKTGNLWIGTASGLNFMDVRDGTIKRYKIRNRIMSLLEDDKGFIWIGTWSDGLYILDPETGEMKHYLANDVISDLHLDSKNIVWIASYNGLLRFNPETGDYKRYVPETGINSISNATVTQVVEADEGVLWIGTWGGGLNKAVLDDDGEIVRFQVYRVEDREGSIGDNGVYRLFYDQFHNLWIGSWNEGLSLLKRDQQQLSPEEAQFWVYEVSVDNPGSLSSNAISTIFVDKSGLLWVGSAKIDRASITDKGLSRYVLPLRIDNLGNKIVVQCFAAYKDQLWVGTSYNLLQYEKQNGVYVLKNNYGEQTYTHNGNTFIAYSIFDMFADSTGLWLGTEDAGVIHYNYTSDLSLDLTHREYYNSLTQPLLPGNKVVDIIPSKKYSDVIWAGIRERGLVKMKTDSRGKLSIESIGRRNGFGALSSNIIRTLHEDRSGKVWIGTENGLNCYDPETGNMSYYFYSPADTNSLNDNTINAILEDSFGNLWIGTNSGLNKKIETSDKSGNTSVKFKGFPETEYIQNGYISGLMEDQLGHLWIRTFQGMLVFGVENEEIEEKYFSQDYRNDRLERNTEMPLLDGRMLVGNLARFALFDSQSINNTSESSGVVLSDIRVYDKSMNRENKLRKDYGLTSAVAYADKIALSNKDKMITFSFSDMDFINSGESGYSYKLEGFDTQWNNAERRNTATYTNLPPGDYTFKVAVTQGKSPDLDTVSSFRVIMMPPWWKSKLATIIYLFIFLGLLYFFQKYSIINARKKSELAFEHLRAEELKKLDEQKTLFFTDITHELRTPLTLILGPSKELLDDKNLTPESHKLAHLINTSTYKLLRLVNQLLEFRKIEKGIPDSLYIQYCNLTNLLHEVFKFFKPMADSRQIEFSLNTAPENIMAYFDPDKMEKIVFNLLSNAFKYSPDNSAISINVFERNNTENEKKVVIEVQDSGIGIAKEYQEKIFERFFQVKQIRTQSTGGIGLFMAKAMIEQHGGTIQLDSEVGKGSCFRLFLPMSKELAAKAVKNEKWKPEDSLTGSAQPEDTIFDNILHDNPFGGLDSKKPHVLVVEDDTDLKEFLCTGLSKHLNVECAGNGKEALAKIKENVPNLILSDVMMPEMDGFELCSILRNDLDYSHIPVIFLTAKTMHEDQIKGLKLGAVDYIHKPFNMVSLSLKIFNLLNLQKQKQERLRTEQLLEPGHIELSSLDEEFLKAAVQSVQNNLDNTDFDVEAFSAELKVSANQAYRKIKALTGQTANEFIRTQRLKVASGLLVQNKRSISEVIYMVGFTSPSYFSRCFKDFYGCTPKEYIEKNT
ncbi:hybrid sensor histidine kinase/response regulator transcription factor [Draconibacterium halophilum]|uniref:histidine kinase n=1 Tax=Draconibacterium halophilum TaxID=2706887 RepID=A0A6C0RC20_9BACT|nr:hybrid sensor histidine kinase/response regulator transcription factor [Draconibacterium halophilum]QIA07649.1 response regulator [Draconibacterium halophilum]